MTWGRALSVEAIFTVALALVVLNSATARQTEENSFYGLAIGFTIVVASVQHPEPEPGSAIPGAPPGEERVQPGDYTAPRPGGASPAR